MSLRLRLLLALVLLAGLALLTLGLGVRQEMSRRLTREHQERLSTLTDIVHADLKARDRDLSDRLTALCRRLESDNDIRNAIGQGENLPGYASETMALMGLDMLRIADNETGRIISSGHYRQEHGVIDWSLKSRLAATANGGGLLRVRSPEGEFLVWGRADSLQLQGKRLLLTAGFAVDSDLLGDLSRGLDLALLGVGKPMGEAATAATHFLDSLELAQGGGSPATLQLGLSRSQIEGLRRQVNAWILALLLAAFLTSLALAFWLSERISRPIIELAGKTASIDLDSLDADFASERRDEVGTLGRFLSEMTARLRRSAESLREAERRATLGDFARQINHDLRNGFTPIRNVVRHLSEILEKDPETLVKIYSERRRTLESSLAYLEDLAGKYSRISRQQASEPCDLNVILREMSGDRVTLRLEPALPRVSADPIGLRRIAENLISNARDSLSSEEGEVVVATAAKKDEYGLQVELRVSDNGSGMDAATRERIFDDFFTTRENGTGLGLSIVRRLVADFGGSLSAESEPEEGSCFTVILPAEEAVEREEKV